MSCSHTTPTSLSYRTTILTNLPGTTTVFTMVLPSKRGLHTLACQRLCLDRCFLGSDGNPHAVANLAVDLNDQVDLGFDQQRRIIDRPGLLVDAERSALTRPQFLAQDAAQRVPAATSKHSRLVPGRATTRTAFAQTHHFVDHLHHRRDGGVEAEVAPNHRRPS